MISLPQQYDYESAAYDEALFRQFFDPSYFVDSLQPALSSDEQLVDCLQAPVAPVKRPAAEAYREEPIKRIAPAPAIAPATSYAPLAPLTSSYAPYSPSLTPASASNAMDPQERRRERNRLAAERCRQRKMDLIQKLQAECAQLQAERERLVEENRRLMAQIRQI